MKPTKTLTLVTLMLITGWLLAACSGSPAMAAQDPTAEPVETQEPQEVNNLPVSNEYTPPDYWVEEVPRMDEQGAVMVEIIPKNLNNPAHTLDFDVRLNTHSVDLSMDLAELATLTTDTGLSVQASSWEAPAGGHHVSGRLSFPSSVNGVALLDGVRKLTLTITNVDAPVRVFTWEK